MQFIFCAINLINLFLIKSMWKVSFSGIFIESCDIVAQ